MAKITTTQRKKLPTSTFALPKKRAFPMPDKSHAADAIRMAAYSEKKGNITPMQKAMIDRKANAKLGKTTAKTKNKGV